MEPENVVISVSSWNILAQKFTRVDFPWQERKLLIERELESLETDILLLQEVTLATFHDDFSFLSPKYSFVVHKVNKKRPNPIGNAIFWKSDYFVLSEESFNSTSLLCHLRRNDQSICILNLHLKAGLHSGESTRIQQMKSCLKLLSSFSRDCPIIMGGDFNDHLIEGGQLYRMLKEENFAGMEQKLPSCFVGGHYQPMDFLLVRGAVLSSHQTVKLYQSEIPNKENPSDHLLIRGQIKFI